MSVIQGKNSPSPFDLVRLGSNWRRGEKTRKKERREEKERKGKKHKCKQRECEGEKRAFGPAKRATGPHCSPTLKLF